MLFSRFLKISGATSKFVVAKNYFYTYAQHAAQVSFKLSDIGEGIREVTVKEWFVNVGDKVSQFDEICEVQSDKASVTITSRYDGVIKKLHYKIDETALVGKALVDIETESEEENKSEHVAIQEKQNETSSGEQDAIQEKQNETSSDILCIPSVRRLAKEHKIDLSVIAGSGKHGRILKEDVLKHLGMITKEQISPETVAPGRTEPIKGFQKAMVKTMSDSLKIPHFVYGDEIIVTELSRLRQNLKVTLESQHLKLSFLPFFIKAVSNALLRFPILNASLDGNCENVIYKSEHNIGVAMDTKAGLAVPVIKNVASLSILDINAELTRLIQNGRSGIFATQDLAGGTFTVSNIGAIGGTYMQPVIMSPQVAIIALGALQVLPRFNESNDVIREEIMTLSGAADHRIVDGATMARFVQSLKKQIQNPHLLFLNL